VRADEVPAIDAPRGSTAPFGCTWLLSAAPPLDSERLHASVAQDRRARAQGRRDGLQGGLRRGKVLGT